MDDLLRESEKHKRQMSHNQKVILGSMTEIGTLGENTERSPGHIISTLINIFKHLNMGGKMAPKLVFVPKRDMSGLIL